MDRTENFSPGFCEYLVPGFAGKNIVLLRIASVICGIILCIILFSLLSFIPQVFAIWFVLIIAFEIAVFRMTKCEFEYSISMGEMTVEAIYGRRWRKKLLNVRVADAERVFPVESFKDREIQRLNPARTVFASPKKSDFMYCLFTKSEGGKNCRTALVFSSCKKLNDAIKFYNRSCFVERT